MFYLSGQLLTEDYAVFNKLARALVGTNNIDTNSRLCMSSAVSGYKRTLGADAPPACYEDLELADTVLIAGSNMAYAHPVLFRRLEAARARRPGMKLIVVDPRRTDTASGADLHLPLTPGSDVALFHAMLNVMVWEGLVDQDYISAHTSGFEALKARIHEFTPGAAAEVCGIPARDIIQAARWFGGADAALSLYTMGLNQSASGTDKNTALIHLHLATGQIGRPGAGPFSLTGQPNAMGGREAGGMATLLPGHRDPAYAGDRAEAAALWGVDALPEAPGASALELFERAREGRIKVLWIAATNPAQSMPDQARARRFGARGFRDRAGSLCRRRDAGPCRPGAARRDLAGEIRHHDHRSAASAACGPPSRRRATPCPTGGWRRRLRSGWRPASRRARPRCSAIAMKARCTPSTPG